MEDNEAKFLLTSVWIYKCATMERLGSVSQIWRGIHRTCEETHIRHRDRETTSVYVPLCDCVCVYLLALGGSRRNHIRRALGIPSSQVVSV